MYESVYQFCCFIDVYRSFRWMKTMLYQHLVKCYDIERNIEVRLDELKLSSETVIVITFRSTLLAVPVVIHPVISHRNRTEIIINTIKH